MPMLGKLHQFTFLSTLLLLAFLPASADTIYVAGDDANLYTIDPTTGATTLIGSTGVAMADIAYSNGNLYGVSYGFQFLVQYRPKYRRGNPDRLRYRFRTGGRSRIWPGRDPLRSSARVQRATAGTRL